MNGTREASELVSLRLRRCTRCGHLECPCCRSDWCDDAECLEQEDGCEKCIYADAFDAEGFARLDALLKRTADSWGAGQTLSNVDGGLLVSWNPASVVKRKPL